MIPHVFVLDNTTVIYKLAYFITRVSPTSKESLQNTWLKSQETSRMMGIIFLLFVNDFKIPLFGNNEC